MRNLLREIVLGDVRPLSLAIVAALCGAIVAVVRITQRDVDKAIQQAKRRLGDEAAQLLVAEAMSEEEMDLPEDPEEDDVKR